MRFNCLRHAGRALKARLASLAQHNLPPGGATFPEAKQRYTAQTGARGLSRTLQMEPLAQARRARDRSLEAPSRALYLFFFPLPSFLSPGALSAFPRQVSASCPSLSAEKREAQVDSG